MSVDVKLRRKEIYKYGDNEGFACELQGKVVVVTSEG
jgi:hypothetical protein